MQIYKNLSLENIPGEIWKDIKNYEGLYQVSNLGRIKSLERISKYKNGVYHKYKAVILKQNDKKEYLQITLHKNNKSHTFDVHVLVCKAFKENIDNKPTVDHINGNAKDNRIDNLRWATRKEQAENESTKESHRKASIENLKKVDRKKAIKATKEAQSKKVMCIQTGKIFISTVEAAEYYNISNKHGIASAANPNHEQRYAGFILDNSGKKIKLEWKYID